MKRKIIESLLAIVIVILFIFPPVSSTNMSSFSNRDKNNIYHKNDQQKVSGYIQHPCDELSFNERQLPEVINEKSAISNVGLMNSSWPMYCHDVRHTGQSPYSTINTTGEEKWRVKFNYSIYSSIVISNDGIIYFGCNDLYFYALHPNGTIKWKYYIGCTVESCPAIDENGVIYVGMSYPWDGLYAFYPNGMLKWRYDAGSILSSPAVGENGIIYFGTQDGMNPPTGAINALYPNGTLKWKYQTNHIVYSSPAIGNNGTIYCGSHDTYLYALYPINGTLKWKFQTGDWIRTSPCIANDGTIYCVSLDNYLYAVYPNGTMKWKTNVGAGTSPTIGQDGTIYAGYDHLYAINPINGSVKWIFNPGPGRTIRGATPCNSVDGTIYFGTFDGGELIAVNSNGTEKWRKNIGICDSAPAIAEDGTIYTGTSYEGGGGLLAFGPGEQKKIEIQSPEPGKLYLFGNNIGSTPRNNTIILGSVKVKVQVYSEDQIESVHFYIDGTDQYNVTKPPYEWRMNRRYGNLFPLKHTITVTGFYEGGCSWSESIDVVYFHLLGI